MLAKFTNLAMQQEHDYTKTVNIKTRIYVIDERQYGLRMC